MLLVSEMMEGLKRWLKIGVVSLLLATLSLGLSAAWWGGNDNKLRESRLPGGNAITNPEALLRYALPIENVTVRKLQKEIEDIAEQLRASRRWGAVKSDLKIARRILDYKEDELLESIPEARQTQAQSIVAQLKEGVTQLEEWVQEKDKENIWKGRSQLLAQIGQLEALMVKDFPFEVPEEYSHLPQLKGRATIEVQTEKGPLTIVVDGYNAPVTAGNFVDLVQRGFYDEIEIIRAEDYYVLQTGDPAGPEDGFVDPATGEYRTIPLEIKVRSEEKPIYGLTLEEVGLYREDPVLPFSAYGTVAMARPDVNLNGGSSQFFFFLFEAELTPAGLNLLDGRYAVFGYTVEGKEVLRKLHKGDRIESMTVVNGSENLVQPDAA